MLKQHNELSMFVRRTIETNEEAGIRPSKTYQSFVATAESHRELSFIEKDVRNYITREVWNVSEQDDAKEFGKYLLRMKEKNQNFFFELNLEGDHSIKHAFWADARSMAACKYFGDVVSFDTTYNINKYSVHPTSVLTFTICTSFGSFNREIVHVCRYNLVFGSFVGVNHHGQSTLLGCALMRNKDINHSNGYSSVGSVAWEGSHQKAFSPTNAHRCKGPSSCPCQQQFITSAFGTL
ncbi:hypothetical protein Ahy_A02g009797 [Arachis hypogaea]|uniref:Uncharacterized protein n=1 Tax=Arachis hypogaea TaxID=3818 RepID=A0A445EI60_ARAHY|nr:hypothetical protein Ahy_A02g009797 [Arachis hypogaea]